MRCLYCQQEMLLTDGCTERPAVRFGLEAYFRKRQPPEARAETVA